MNNDQEKFSHRLNVVKEGDLQCVLHDENTRRRDELLEEYDLKPFQVTMEVEREKLRIAEILKSTREKFGPLSDEFANLFEQAEGELRDLADLKMRIEKDFPDKVLAYLENYGEDIEAMNSDRLLNYLVSIFWERLLPQRFVEEYPGLVERFQSVSFSDLHHPQVEQRFSGHCAYLKENISVLRAQALILRQYFGEEPAELLKQRFIYLICTEMLPFNSKFLSKLLLQLKKPEREEFEQYKRELFSDEDGVLPQILNPKLSKNQLDLQRLFHVNKTQNKSPKYYQKGKNVFVLNSDESSKDLELPQFSVADYREFFDRYTDLDALVAKIFGLKNGEIPL